MIRRRTLSAVLVALATAAPAAAAQTLDFESVPVGTSTRFFADVGGISTLFTSSTAEEFIVMPGFFSTLTGNVLADNGPLQSTLWINFSSPVSGVFMSFATNGPGIVTLEARIADAWVVGATAEGVVPDGFAFPEGTIGFSSPTDFQAIRLSATSPDFAIDDLRISQAVVIPEPSTVLLLGSGLLALGVGARRGRRTVA